MKKTTKRSGQPETLVSLNRTVPRFVNGRIRRVPRIERLGWKHLAEIYNDDRTTNDVKNLIEREARRCGYDLDTILNLNG